MSFHRKKRYQKVNFLTKKMRTFFRTTIKIVALRQIKARARTWISGHVFPTSAFSEHQTYRQSPALFLWKGAFCRKIGVHSSQKKKNSSPNNSNYFIILPNNSKRVSLKLKSSETKLVWSNLILAETCHVTSARTKTFFSSIGQLHDDDIWLQLPEFISVLLCYSNLSIPLRIKEQ